MLPVTVERVEDTKDTFLVAASTRDAVSGSVTPVDAHEKASDPLGARTGEVPASSVTVKEPTRM